MCPIRMAGIAYTLEFLKPAELSRIGRYKHCFTCSKVFLSSFSFSLTFHLFPAVDQIGAGNRPVCELMLNDTYQIRIVLKANSESGPS